MLAKVNRINTAKDYIRVQEQGKVYQYNTFGVVIVNRNDDNPPRFGFVVSTKISKSAVDRNLYKRLMREVVRINIYHAKKGIDVVFLGKPTLFKTPASQIMKEVQKAIDECELTTN